jgi:hypothetical protein
LVNRLYNIKAIAKKGKGLITITKILKGIYILLKVLIFRVL